MRGEVDAGVQVRVVLEPILHAWQINYYLMECDADIDRISLAFEEANRMSKPVAVLIGKEGR